MGSHRGAQGIGNDQLTGGGIVLNTGHHKVRSRASGVAQSFDVVSSSVLSAATWIAILVAVSVALPGCRTNSDTATVEGGDEVLTNPETDPPTRFPIPFQILAHRGASAYAPENTLPAYRVARDIGVYEVELDIQLSSDDVVIIYHDAELEPKTGNPGTVRDHTAAQLVEMDIGTWFDRTHPEIEEKFAGTRLATLDEFFREFSSEFYYHIGLKSTDADLPRLALAIADHNGVRGRVRFTSFHLEQVERVHASPPVFPRHS